MLGAAVKEIERSVLLWGALAKKYCDFAVLTNDNPRGENPTDIINEIKNGIDNLITLSSKIEKKRLNMQLKKQSKTI